MLTVLLLINNFKFNTLSELGLEPRPTFHHSDICFLWKYSVTSRFVDVGVESLSRYLLT